MLRLKDKPPSGSVANGVFGMFLLVTTSSMTLCSIQFLVQEVPGFLPWRW